MSDQLDRFSNHCSPQWQEKIDEWIESYYSEASRMQDWYEVKFNDFLQNLLEKDCDLLDRWSSCPGTTCKRIQKEVQKIDTMYGDWLAMYNEVDKKYKSKTKKSYIGAHYH